MNFQQHRRRKLPSIWEEAEDELPPGLLDDEDEEQQPQQNIAVTGVTSDPGFDLDSAVDELVAITRDQNRQDPTPTEPAEAAAPEEEEDGDDWDDLFDVQERQREERQALEEELASRRAEALQQADARAGLAGMGLSGASAALRGDVARVQDREADLAMANLGRQQSDEAWQQLQRSIALWDFEEEDGVDYDGDGFIGRPPPDAIDPDDPRLNTGAPIADWNQDGTITEQELSADERAKQIAREGHYRQAIEGGATVVDSPPEGTRRWRSARDPESGAEYWVYVDDSTSTMYLVPRGEEEGE